MEKLKQIAQEIGDQATLDRLSCASKIQDRNHTHIAIMGTTNCGKTTLINGILGQEIQEPSMLPDEGKPTRISFGQMEPDERCNCETVFSREWGGIGVLLYEVNSDRNFGTPGGLSADDFDVIFYSMPATRFMTSEDKNTLANISYLPINIILTKLDEVRDEQRAQIVEFAQALAKENAAQLIIADPAEWGQVSMKMRSSLPITIELDKKRKEHVALIERECKEYLVSSLNEAIAEQERIISSTEQENSTRTEQLRLETTTHAKNLAAIKLDCTKTENSIIEQIRKILLNTIRFADAKLQNTRKQNFNKESMNEFAQMIESNIIHQINKIDDTLQHEVRRIVADANSKQLLEPENANAFLAKYFDEKTVNSVPTADYEKYSVTPADSLIKIGLAVGGISVAAWLMPISAVFSCGITAATVALGGVQLYQKMNAEKETAAQTLRSEIQKLIKNVQDTLTENVETIFSSLKASFNIPKTIAIAKANTSNQRKRIEYLESLKTSIIEK